MPNTFEQLKVVPGMSELTIESGLTPRQVSVKVALAVMFGNGLTFTMACPVPVYPFFVFPITYCFIVAVELTVTFGFVPNPFDQLKVVPGIAELTIKPELSPRQISVGVALDVTFGNG